MKKVKHGPSLPPAYWGLFSIKISSGAAFGTRPAYWRRNLLRALNGRKLTQFHHFLTTFSYFVYGKYWNFGSKLDHFLPKPSGLFSAAMKASSLLFWSKNRGSVVRKTALYLRWINFAKPTPITSGTRDIGVFVDWSLFRSIQNFTYWKIKDNSDYFAPNDIFYLYSI